MALNGEPEAGQTLYGRMLTGRCSNGAERDRGKLVHLTVDTGGGWSLALCRAKPGRLSSGWTHETHEPTCPRCLKKRAKLEGK